MDATGSLTFLGDCDIILWREHEGNILVFFFPRRPICHLGWHEMFFAEGQWIATDEYSEFHLENPSL